MQLLQPLAQPCLRGSELRVLTRIMLLDDDEIDQMACKRMISRAEITKDLVRFTAPAAALAYLSDPECPPIDLILLDVNMPRMDGFEFLEAAQELIALPVMPPVLVMLATPLGPFHRDQARKFDVIKGYLDKPLSADDLTVAIRSL